MTHKALKLALEALIGDRAFLERDAPVEIWGVNDKAITAIKAALAQEQEPWCMKMNGCTSKCEDCPVEVAQDEPVAKYSDIVSDGGLDPRNKFDAPPQRTWVGLTEEEVENLCLSLGAEPIEVRFIETKLKELNT